jgi:arginyl-tRNA synthetase
MSAINSDPVTLLEGVFRRAIAAHFGDQFADIDPLIKPSANPQFGDFQANFAMGLSKQLPDSPKPREIALWVIATLRSMAGPTGVDDLAEDLEVAGPGFINIRLKSEAFSRMLDAMDSPALGVVPDLDSHPVAIDMCGVNVAKQMHVGHLRATIIGDALARVFERLGRTVFRENHLGDWGLPIGMVLHQLRSKQADLDVLTLDDLDKAYREAQAAAKDEAFVETAKRTLVKLQNNDPELLRDWHKLIDVTMQAVNEALVLLNVDLTKLNNHGESFYRDRLPGVVDAFMRAGVAKEDAGAIVVPFKDRERPLLIRKSDGGFLYSTTDLAGVRFRVQELGADYVIYVVDARQRDHFKDVFDAARLNGWDLTPDGTPATLVHVGFGTVLGEDKKPLKTRSGENITLRALLMEAIERGTDEVRKRASDPNAPTHNLSLGELQRIGQAVGIGAVKYADLANDLVRDYVFSFDRMLAFEGDTGPYLQYAHARVCSIFTKAGIGFEDSRGHELRIAEPAERRLALVLLRYGSVVADVGRTLEPHRLCAYLHTLAEAYSGFYQDCPVLKAADEPTRRSRLRLCNLVRRVMADGLHLLGIDAPQRM